MQLSSDRQEQKMSLLGKYSCDNVTEPTYSSSSMAFSIKHHRCICWELFRDSCSVSGFQQKFVDLIVGLITGPMSTVCHIFEGVAMLKQRFKDLVRITFFISWPNASLLSLPAPALDRYLAITYPLMYRTKLNPIGALLISLMVWIVSILFPMIHFIVGYKHCCRCYNYLRGADERQGFQVFPIPS